MQNTHYSGDSSGGSESTNTAAVAAGVVVASIAILLLVGIGIIVGVVIKARSKCWQPQNVEGNHLCPHVSLQIFQK